MSNNELMQDSESAFSIRGLACFHCDSGRQVFGEVQTRAISQPVGRSVSLHMFHPHSRSNEVPLGRENVLTTICIN